ncbi:MAG: alpha/beta fold hydrolase [Nitrososphaera sp.]
MVNQKTIVKATTRISGGNNTLASINGINLYYDDIGKTHSLAVVLIHGFPFSSSMWTDQVEMLKKKNLRVLTYDIRGHGQSDIGDGQYTFELFVDDLIALLDHRKIAKTILCGFSMGGYIALRAIERNPDRFTALVLCDTMSSADSNEAKIRRANSVKMVKNEGVERFAEGFLKAVFAPETFNTKPDIIDEIRSIIRSNSPLGICGALLAMAGRTDTISALPKISVPTLILVGEHDAVTPPDAARHLRDRIPNSKLHLIENAAHMSNLENPIKFNGHLANFVDEID